MQFRNIFYVRSPLGLVTEDAPEIITGAEQTYWDSMVPKSQLPAILTERLRERLQTKRFISEPIGDGSRHLLIKVDEILAAEVEILG
jgi:hypothetical protein